MRECGRFPARTGKTTPPRKAALMELTNTLAAAAGGYLALVAGIGGALALACGIAAQASQARRVAASRAARRARIATSHTQVTL